MLYNELKKNIDTIEFLYNLDLIPYTLIRNLKMFEYYQSLPKESGVYNRYELTADVFGISSDRVKNIILKLSK